MQTAVLWLTLVALAAPPGAGPGAGLQVEVEGPLDVDLGARTAVGEGPIRIAREGFRVCCGHLELAYGDDGVERATCTRDVIFAWDPPDSAAAPEAGAPPAAVGTAGRARYEGGRFHLEDGVTLWSSGGRLTGDQGVYDGKARQVRFSGQPARWSAAPPPPELGARCRPPSDSAASES